MKTVFKVPKLELSKVTDNDDVDKLKNWKQTLENDINELKNQTQMWPTQILLVIYKMNYKLIWKIMEIT